MPYVPACNSHLLSGIIYLFWRTPFCISFSTHFWHSVVYLKMSEFYLIIELLFTWDQMCSSVNVYLVLVYVQQDPEPLGSLNCLTGPACVLTSVPRVPACVQTSYERVSLYVLLRAAFFCSKQLMRFIPVLLLSGVCSFLLLTSILLGDCAAVCLSGRSPVGGLFTWSPVLSSAE